jgi:hypothetical protein
LSIRPLLCFYSESQVYLCPTFRSNIPPCFSKIREVYKNLQFKGPTVLGKSSSRAHFILVDYDSVYRVLMGKPEGKRPLGRPRRRWEDNIEMDLQEVGCGGMDWIELAQDRSR